MSTNANGLDGHLRLDRRGVVRLDGSRVRVIDLVLDQRAFGWTPQELCEQYPHLSPAQVQAALAYYHKHKADLDAEIERRLKEVDQARDHAGESPVARRLRAEGKLK